jgi:protein-tyrosine phosphatase
MREDQTVFAARAFDRQEVAFGGLFRMNWILPGRLAIGNYLDAAAAEREGVRAVLSLAIEHEDVHPNTVHVWLDDGPNSPALMAHAIRELARLLRTSPPVLVHCHAGLSRSPAVVAGYLANFENYSLRDAFVFIDERRPIQLSPGVLPTLKMALAQMANEPAAS